MMCQSLLGLLLGMSWGCLTTSPSYYRRAWWRGGRLLIAMSVWLVASLGVGGIWGGRRHAPRFHGAAGCKLKAMLRNNPASGQAAGKGDADTSWRSR